MIDPKNYLSSLKENNIDFYTGVPDSLLKQFCACVTDELGSENHIIAANEGGAVGLAIGHHLGTGKVPMVYLQNSGLGNIINPLISLASKEVYGIPMLIMIGWRGEPGVKDEPQHIHQGRVMNASLDSMEIPKYVLDFDENIAIEQSNEAIQLAIKKSTPVAIIVRKNTFNKYNLQKKEVDLPLSREEAIVASTNSISNDDVIVGTTGMPSRELFEHRSKNNLGHHRDFLTVGGMGHASQIALGIAKTKKNKTIYCFDGDGAILMHMGSLGIIGQSKTKNFVHILFNNGVHDSVGGQPTVGFDLDFCKIALSCGYSSSKRIIKLDDIEASINSLKNNDGPHFIEIQVRPGNRADIGRPTSTPTENKDAIMEFLKRD